MEESHSNGDTNTHSPKHTETSIPLMAEQRERHVFMTKVAEQAERYDGTHTI